MFPKNLEVLDPENPTIYYYTNHSTQKPQSFTQTCNSGRKITGYNLNSSKVMVIFGVLYALFLLYIAIEKPQFAVEYAQEVKRKTTFSDHPIQVTGNISALWLKNKLSLSLNIQNMKNVQTQIRLKNIQYRLDGKQEWNNIPLPAKRQKITLEEHSTDNLSLEIPLKKDQFLPKTVQVKLSTDKEEEELTVFL